MRHAYNAVYKHRYMTTEGRAVKLETHALHARQLRCNQHAKANETGHSTMEMHMRGTSKEFRTASFTYDRRHNLLSPRSIPLDPASLGAPTVTHAFSPALRLTLDCFSSLEICVATSTHNTARYIMATPVGHARLQDPPQQSSSKTVPEALILREGLSRREFKRRQGLCLAAIHAKGKQGARDIHPANFLAPYLSDAARVIYDTIMHNPAQREVFKITGPSHDVAYYVDDSIVYVPEKAYGPQGRGLIRWVEQHPDEEQDNPGVVYEPRCKLQNLAPLRDASYVPSFEEFGEAIENLGNKSTRKILAAMRMGREVSMQGIMRHLALSLIHELDSTTAMNELQTIRPRPGESLTTYAQRINELQQKQTQTETKPVGRLG